MAYLIGQQTPAIQAIFGSLRGTRVRGRKRAKRRRATAKARTARRSTRKRSSARGRRARLVKGSAAARRYMAKIRKMRKR